MANLHAKLTFYAASRVADQVSFGATPALVAQLQQQGLEAWIDQQLALPINLIVTPAFAINYNLNNQTENDRAERFLPPEFWSRTLTGPDQLRQRVAWALLQYVPSAMGRPYGRVEYFNLMSRYAFGNYADFLAEVSVHPQMGQFLNNDQNRPPSSQCPACTLNENYGRELLQLFSLGVVQLNPDGSVIRDAQGKPKETYTQADVEAAARALTGWRFAPSAAPLPETNGYNAGVLMQPDSWPPAHDRGTKTIMGKSLAANQDAPQELKSLIAILMQHPNIAPFVSLRLIQHLVTSNPSPAYLARVSAAFRNNGAGVAGDMRAVLRAVLLDAEARRGDVPGADSLRFGKIREPVLFYAASLRGLSCNQGMGSAQYGLTAPSVQTPFDFPSVFSYYQATDRAAGSNLLAPEQKLLTATELSERVGRLNWWLANTDNPDLASNLAKCDLATFTRALAQSPQAFADLVSNRFFRGAMPPLLRTTLQTAIARRDWYGDDATGALQLLQQALATAYFGAIK